MANEVNDDNAVLITEEDEPMDTSCCVTITESTEHHKSLVQAGLPQKVAERLDEIFQTEHYKSLVQAGLPQKVAERLDEIFQTEQIRETNRSCRGFLQENPLFTTSCRNIAHLYPWTKRQRNTGC